MTRLIRSAALMAMLTTVCACTTISLAPAGPLKLAGGHGVILGREWSDVSAIMPQRQNKVRVLTIDGHLLNRLYIADGLSPGEGLIKAISKERPTPTYHRDMAPNELVEFVTESVAGLGYQRIDSGKLRPGKFGGGDALRFDISGLTESGLEISGSALVAEADGKLYVLLYLAPGEHYFTAILPEVEALMASAT